MCKENNLISSHVLPCPSMYAGTYYNFYYSHFSVIDSAGKTLLIGSDPQAFSPDQCFQEEEGLPTTIFAECTKRYDGPLAMAANVAKSVWTLKDLLVAGTGV